MLKIRSKFKLPFKWHYRVRLLKRLGYAKDTKLLIIHADDLGMSKSENSASFRAMENGMINSGSVMVPCPEINEVAEYVKIHPEADIGIHLTITSEWSSYKWRSLLSDSKVSSIIDKNGYFFEDKKEIIKNANIKEVENEFRAQITHAIKLGINPSHIDSHMFSAFSSHKILKAYLFVGKEYKLPALITYDLPIWTWFMNKLVMIDHLYIAENNDYEKGLVNYYRQVLKKIKPGLNCILVHTAYDDEEMKNITRNQTVFGSSWRQSDFDFFTSSECQELIEKNNIKLITWRKIREKLFI